MTEEIAMDVEVSGFGADSDLDKGAVICTVLL